MNFKLNWSKIKDAIDKLICMLHSDKKVSRYFDGKEYSEIYEICFDLCTYRCKYKKSVCYQENMYEKYNELLESYLEEVFLSDNLKLFCFHCDKYQIFCKWLTRFFNYLNRSYVKNNCVLDLESVCLEKFQTLCYVRIKEQLFKMINDEINESREGYEIENDLVVNSIMHLRHFTMNNDFDESFLSESDIYFTRKSEYYYSNLSKYEYLKKTYDILKDENRYYFHPDTIFKLNALIKKTFLKSRYKEILDLEFLKMIEGDKGDDLRLTYELVEDSDYMANIFGIYLSNKGQKMDIEELVNFHNDAEKKIRNYFGKSQSFSKVLCKVYNKILNEREIHTLLSGYLDGLLKRSNKMSEEENEYLIVCGCKLINYINDKDKFLQCYLVLLSRRLLSEKSVIDVEKFAIKNLMDICGKSSISKMETMVNDFLIGNSVSKEFNYPGCDNQILTYGQWPSVIKTDFVLPQMMQDYKEKFTKFYEERSFKRKLIWVDWLGTVLLKGIYKSKVYDFQMSTPQSLVILFLEDGRKSYNEIKSHFNLTDNYLRPLLHSVSCAKYKLVKKLSDDNKIHNTDEFEINKVFSCAHRLVKIPNFVINEEVYEPSKIHEDRNFLIDSKIVRIMKTRKILKHIELIPEVQGQINLFKTSISDIKKRIENLIIRDYLKRDEQDYNKYVYIA